MSAFLLIVAFLLAGVVALQLAARADPKSLAKLVRFGGAGLVGIVGLVLLLTGRFGMAVPAFMFAFWILGRRLPIPGMQGGFGSAPKSPGQVSEVTTSFFSMVLDHDSGEMAGKVLQGQFAGVQLGDLQLSDLYVLLEEVGNDPDSERLLEAYLDRHVGPDWREDAGRPTGSGSQSFGPMTRDEAYEVLGLRPGATVDAIRRAHKDLMLKLHPDHGGSTVLAARVNAAKDLLLGD
jgi:DnaJ-like protein